MRKPELSELETMIAAAEAEATESLSAAPARDGYPALRASRVRASEIMNDALDHLDLDRAELDRLQREHDVELRRFADDAKRRAIEGSAEASKRLDAFVMSQRAPLDVLPEDPFGPGSHLLLSVDFVRAWPTPGNLRDWHLEPGLNWAKWRSEVSGDAILREAREKVSFYILWQNPKDVAILADILVRLTINGRCECYAEWGGVSSWVGFPDSRSYVDVGASLTVWPLWVPHAARQPIASVPIESLNAKGGFFSDSDDASISTAPALTTTRFAIPADAYILIEASVAADYEYLAGSADVDFASANLFSVGLPYAVVTLPPEMNVNA